MSKTIGVIGLGSIGMRHARNLRDMGHRALGVDTDRNRRALAVGEKIEGLAIERDIWNECVAAVIASPSREHLEHMRRAIDRGLHVFIEKPIASERTDLVDELLAHAKSKGVIVFVGNNLRFRSCVRKARAWLAELSIIGRPVWASFTLAQHNTKPDYLRDGVTLNWGAHECDLALHLLGPGAVRSAWISSQDDIADIAIEHQDNGCRTHIHLDYLTRDEIRRCVIVGTIGQIELDIRRNTAELRTANGDCVSSYSQQSFDQDYTEEMQAFLDRIDGKETLGATGEDGLAALKVILDARRMAAAA